MAPGEWFLDYSWPVELIIGGEDFHFVWTVADEAGNQKLVDQTRIAELNSRS